MADKAHATSMVATARSAMGQVSQPSAVTRPPSRPVVTSPMVGRFLSGSGPAATLGLKLGAQVCVGEPLCVIEALKIPTVIEAARNGKIA